MKSLDVHHHPEVTRTVTLRCLWKQAPLLPLQPGRYQWRPCGEPGSPHPQGWRTPPPPASHTSMARGGGGEAAMEPGHLPPLGSNEARRLPLLERGQRNPPKIQGWNKTQSRLRPKVIGCPRQDNHKLGVNTESVGGGLDCVPQKICGSPNRRTSEWDLVWK